MKRTTRTRLRSPLERDGQHPIRPLSAGHLELAAGGGGSQATVGGSGFFQIRDEGG